MAILTYIKSCFGRQHQTQNHNSKSFRNPSKENRKSPHSGVIEEIDHQRKTMIRKSLASRASSWATVRIQEDTPQHHTHDTGSETEDSRNNSGLRYDWKAYEANLQRNQSTLIRRHPGVNPSTANSRGGCSSNQQYSFASSPKPPQLPELFKTQDLR